MDYTSLLPDHILVDIFKYLTPKTIKRCNFVCKRWDEIISNSKWIMNNFWIYIDEKQIIKSKRKYENIVMRKLTLDSLDVICQHNIRELELIQCNEVVDSWYFMNELGKLPQLNKLFAKIDLTDVDLADDMKVQLNRLEHIECRVELTRLLNVKSLLSLHVSFDADFSSDDFINFVKQQKNLKELALNGKQIEKLFQSSELLKLDCRLTFFRFVSDFLIRHHYVFIKFLQIHQETLKELWIYSIGESYDIVKEFVLKNFKNLDILLLSFLDWHLIDGDGSKYEDYKFFSLLKPESFRILMRENFPTPPIEVAVNIEYIHCALPNNHESNKQLIRALKKVKKFTLNCFTFLDESFLKETIEYMSEVMTDLETIEVREISSTAVYFPKLNGLIIDWIFCPNLFNAFIQRHSATLESIKIKNAKDLNQGTVDEMMKCKNLKYLDVTSKMADYGIFNSCSLTDHFFNLSLDNKRFKFMFPDDKLEWDEFISSVNIET